MIFLFLNSDEHQPLTNALLFLFYAAVHINIHGDLDGRMSQNFRKCLTVKSHFRTTGGKSMPERMNVDTGDFTLLKELLEFTLYISGLHTFTIRTRQQV